MTVLWRFSLSLLVLILAQVAMAVPTFNCANNESYRPKDTDTKWAWTYSQLPANQVQGIAVVVHGLNTKPQRMMTLAQLFSSQNYLVLNVTLSGHGGNLEAWKTASRKTWIHDLYGGYCAAKAKADALQVPLHYVGFSLGGALGVDLLTDPNFADVFYDKMILIAPALAIKPVAKLVQILNILSPRFILPSANSKSYRANEKGTSIAAYNALFASVNNIKARSLYQANAPTLVMIDPRDELVSQSGLTKLIQTHGLSRWDLREINNDQSYLDTSHHHLMIDLNSMGAKNWSLMKSWILEFNAR